jgi:hypothetical protein
MSTPKPVAPGVEALTLAKECLGVIRERVYAAGLRLGKVLKRREAMAQRAVTTESNHADAPV